MIRSDLMYTVCYADILANRSAFVPSSSDIVSSIALLSYCGIGFIQIGEQTHSSMYIRQTRPKHPVVCVVLLIPEVHNKDDNIRIESENENMCEEERQARPKP